MQYPRSISDDPSCFTVNHVPLPLAMSMGTCLAQYSTHYYAQIISIQIHQYLSEVCSSDVNENVFGVQRDTGVLTCGMKRIKDQIDDCLHVAWQHTQKIFTNEHV